MVFSLQSPLSGFVPYYLFRTRKFVQPKRLFSPCGNHNVVFNTSTENEVENPYGNKMDERTNMHWCIFLFQNNGCRGNEDNRIRENRLS